MKTILERAIDLARLRGAQYAGIRVVDTRTENIDIGPPITSQGTYETPVKNLRFTQSFVQALADVEAIGKDTRLLLSSYGNLAARVPASKIGKLNFTGAAV